MSTRSSKRSQASTSGRTASVSGRNKPQTSGRRPSASGRGAAPEPAARPSARTSARTSGRAAAQAPSDALVPERPLSNRGSKRTAAAAAPAGASPSGRTSARTSSRQSKRDLDVSNEYKSQRQSAAAKNKTFGTIAAIFILVFLIISAVGLYVWYTNTAGVIEDNARRKAAFTTWLQVNEAAFRTKANTVATQMKSIIDDLPEDKSSPEMETKLVAKYGSTLSSCGADYAWCKKTWNLKDKTFSLNISPNNAKEFLMTPANAAPLGDPISLQAINGIVSQSGVLSLFWDADNKKTVAVLRLDLAPAPAAQAAGGPQVKAIPPTSFYLWFPTEKLDADAEAHLRKITTAPPDKKK